MKPANLVLFCVTLICATCFAVNLSHDYVKVLELRLQYDFANTLRSLKPSLEIVPKGEKL